MLIYSADKREKGTCLLLLGMSRDLISPQDDLALTSKMIEAQNLASPISMPGIYSMDIIIHATVLNREKHRLKYCNMYSSLTMLFSGWKIMPLLKRRKQNHVFWYEKLFISIVKYICKEIPIWICTITFNGKGEEKKLLKK